VNRRELVPLGGNVDDWLIAFLDGEGDPRWWHYFLKPGFRHCLAFGFDGRCWLQVDCMLNLLDVRSFANAEMTLVLEILASHDAVILAARRRSVVSHATPRAFVYCVSTVKHLLGLRSKALTPYFLYRALLRQGAQVIDLKESKHDGDGHDLLPGRLGPQRVGGGDDESPRWNVDRGADPSLAPW
jgi:hypothetical protein